MWLFMIRVTKSMVLVPVVTSFYHIGRKIRFYVVFAFMLHLSSQTKARI